MLPCQRLRTIWVVTIGISINLSSFFPTPCRGDLSDCDLPETLLVPSKSCNYAHACTVYKCNKDKYKSDKYKEEEEEEEGLFKADAVNEEDSEEFCFLCMRD